MAPKPLFGFEVLRHSYVFEFTFEKETWGLKMKYKNVCPYNWKKKKIIFFELPYWEALLFRHNLDVMHIERMFATG